MTNVCPPPPPPGLGDLTQEETRAIKQSIEAIKKGSNQERLSQVLPEPARNFSLCLDVPGALDRVSPIRWPINRYFFA